MITIAKHKFHGPFPHISSLKDSAGVYVIIDHRESEDKYIALDVGESLNVKTRVENHDRMFCWTQNRLGTLQFAAYYTPGWTPAERRELEKTVRDATNPPCGS